MENNFGDRLDFMRKTKGMKHKELAEALNLAGSSVNHLVSNKSKPSYEVILKIKDTFPDYELEWILTGKGEMRLNSQNLLHNEREETNSYLETLRKGYENRIASLEETVRTLASMVHFPGRDLGGQPIFPKPSEASKAIAKAKCNRKAGLSMFRKGSFRMPVGQA